MLVEAKEHFRSAREKNTSAADKFGVIMEKASESFLGGGI